MNPYPVLYSFRRCPYAMRARMALHHAGIQCVVREVDLKDKPQALLDISPKATVPVLQLPDDRVLDESLDIMRQALAENDPDGWMRADTEDMQRLIHQNDNAFKYHLDRYKYPERFGPDTDAGQHFSDAAVFLRDLEWRLTRHPFLFGSAASLADVALFPFVRQFAAVDAAAFEHLAVTHVQAWLSGWLNKARFTSIMLKHKPWQAGDPPVFLI